MAEAGKSLRNVKGYHDSFTSRKEAMNNEADLRASIEIVYSTLKADMGKVQECIE